MATAYMRRVRWEAQQHAVAIWGTLGEAMSKGKKGHRRLTGAAAAQYLGAKIN